MLGSRQELDQVGVDQVYRQLRAGDATDARLPKGHSPTTMLWRPRPPRAPLTNAVELRASGLLSIVAPLATSRVKRAVAANLDTLRQILERDNQRGSG